MAILKVCDYLEDHQLERFPMRELTLYRFMCSQLAEGALPAVFKVSGHCLLSSCAGCLRVANCVGQQALQWGGP